MGTGGGGTGHQIDESVGVGVYFADAGFAGFGGNEHDDTDIILQSDGFVTLFVIAEGEVGNNDAVDAAFHALLAEGFEAELHDGIEVPHKDKRDADIATDVVQLFEKQAEGHAVVQGAGGGILDDNAVGHGVTERNSDFNHADSVSFEGTDNVGSTVEVGTACTKVNGQQILGAVLEKLVNAVQHTIYNFTIYYLLFGCAIYAACYDLQFYNLLFTIWLRNVRRMANCTLYMVNSKSSNSKSIEFFQEVCDAFHILYSRCRLETAVDVDTCEIGMAELPEGFYAVGVDATAKQERGGTVVAVQEVPVELVAGTAVLRGLGVEEVVVAQTVVGRDGKQVLGQQDGESLDEVQACIVQGTAVLGSFIAMQLDVVKAETVGIHQDVFLTFVDKDADALGAGWQIPGHLAQTTGRFGVEDKTNHIYTLQFYIADVFCFGHSAYFDERRHFIYYLLFTIYYLAARCNAV